MWIHLNEPPVYTRRLATSCPKSVTLRVGVGNLSISFYAALVWGHLFPIKILRAVHTPITFPGPPWPISCTHLVTRLDSQWSRFFCANSQPAILPCAFPQCSLIPPVFCVHGCVYFTAAVCSGSKKRPKHTVTRRRWPTISCTAGLKIQRSCLVICCQSRPSCVICGAAPVLKNVYVRS